MAKNYKENEQAFGVGDIVTDGQFKMKILNVMHDEDDSFWYECVPIDFKMIIPFTREIPQRKLEAFRA